MQVFGNVATEPVRKESKTTKRAYYELRLCESQRGVDPSPCWYSVRIMKESNPGLAKGDFVKVTGKLKVDFYVGRDGKPSGTLLIIAFEASKIARPSTLQGGVDSAAPVAPRETVKEQALAPQQGQPPELAPRKTQVQTQERQLATESQHESDWSTLYS